MGMGVAAVLSLLSGIGVGLIRRDSTAPNNEEETEGESIRPIREQSVAEIIQHQISENRHLEYKSVLHWHKYIEERYCNDTQHEVLRTIAGFLNTDGGTLLVGVEEQEDDQNGGIRYTPITVENDAFESEDEGKQHVVDIVPRLTPNPEHMGKIEVDYESAEGHRVLRIDCEPSHRPVFLADKRIGREEEQRFFKRAAAATIELEGAEMMDYIEDHFDDKWIRQLKQTLPENWT
jgi:predicted HTH transcriptional regulator